MNNPDKALDHYLKSLEIKEGLNDRETIARTYYNIGILYLRMGRIDLAKEYATKALEQGEKNLSPGTLSMGYELLSNVYAKVGEYKKAWEYDKKYRETYITALNAKNEHKIADIQIKYENEKKEREIAELSRARDFEAKEARRESLLKNLFITAFIIFFALSAIIYFLYKNRLTALKELHTAHRDLHKIHSDLLNAHKDLQDASAKIKVLKGLIPICCNCKKIRNDQGYWEQIESYLSQHTEADFSHGICPDCMKELYPDYGS
jgi:hypothetical protein